MPYRLALGFGGIKFKGPGQVSSGIQRLCPFRKMVTKTRMSLWQAMRVWRRQPIAPRRTDTIASEVCHVGLSGRAAVFLQGADKQVRKRKSMTHNHVTQRNPNNARTCCNVTESEMARRAASESRSKSNLHAETF